MQRVSQEEVLSDKNIPCDTDAYTVIPRTRQNIENSYVPVIFVLVRQL